MALTPEQCRCKIIEHKRAIEHHQYQINELARQHIPEFHFMNLKVSTFWHCDKSPVGMCVFKLNEWGEKAECKYCDEPAERK